MAQPGGSNVPPWNKGRKVGQKRALRPQEVWLIRDRLRAEGRVHDLALFNLALDSKLPARDLVCLQVNDVWYPHRVRQRALREFCSPSTSRRSTYRAMRAA
jgi:hypothetical protein